MNTYIQIIIGLACLIPCTLPAQTSAMTYNIRYDNPDDNENAWPHRKEEITKMIHYYSPELLGIQEGLHHQVTYLDSTLHDYTYIGVGRDDGDTKGEYTAIFYQHDRLHLVSSNTYWLSPTPNQVSVGWDASMERIVTYGLFIDKITNDTLHVFNAHFDHRGPQARENSAAQIVKMIEDKHLLDKKVIVMGDFNCEPHEPPMKVFTSQLDDHYKHSKAVSYGPLGTNNRFDTNFFLDRRIDYVLTKNLNVSTYRHIDDRRHNNLWLSDHLPVLIKIE